MKTIADYIHRVGTLLTNKTEWSQAIGRLVVIPILVTHFFFAQSSALAVSLLFMGIAIVWAFWVHAVPYIRERTFAACILDNVGVSAALFAAGPEHPGLALLYFWIMMGNGYRYSSVHATVSIISTVVTFWVAVLFSERWDGFLSEAVELTTGFVLIGWFTYRLMANIEQITLEAKAQELRARRFETKAKRDGLTGLCNREAAIEFLTKASFTRDQVGVLFIDLDNFKQFNDQYGHHVGDQVLVNISKRLTRCVRGHDLVYRYAGDEFIVVVCDDDRATINTIANRISVEMGAPISVKENPDLHVTGSIGIAILGVHGQSVSAVLRNADSAMYVAKRLGRNQIAWYDEK